jgi:hypothetical protein
MNPLANWQRFTERRAAACARQREQDKADAAALAVVEPPREMVFKTFVTPPPPQSPSWDADAWLQGKLEAFAGMLGEEAGEGERRILTTPVFGGDHVHQNRHFT